MDTPQKTPAKQPAVNRFPGRTRALACIRPRLAVGTDARHRALVSRTTGIIVIRKKARNITIITMKHPANNRPAASFCTASMPGIIASETPTPCWRQNADSSSKNIENPRNITFYTMRHPTLKPETLTLNPLIGRPGFPLPSPSKLMLNT